MDEFEEYERELNQIREKNNALIVAFESSLLEKGLSEKTVYKHCENIDFYINEFLLYETPKAPAEGVEEVEMFLGYWFIRKALWASESSIRSNAASLKKFYDFLAERGEVDPQKVQEMKRTIKERLPQWIATVKRYDDPSLDIEDVWEW